MSLAVDAGDLGIWIWDLARSDIWASDSWRALFGFAQSERLDFDGVLQRLHPDDREHLQQAHAMAVAGSSERPIRDRIPVDAAGWRDPLDRVPRPRRVRRHRPAGPDARRLSRDHRAQTRRAGDAAPAAGDRPRRARLDDGPARVRTGARDQSAARGDPAQRRGGGAVPAAPVAGPRRNPRDSARHPRGRRARRQRHRPHARPAQAADARHAAPRRRRARGRCRGARAGRCGDAAGEAGRGRCRAICRTCEATACICSRCCSTSSSTAWTRSTGRAGSIGASP